MKKLLICFCLFLSFTFIIPNPVYASENPPEIKGEAAITIDIDTKEIIYAKNIDKQMFPASTTKLLTAILLADTKKPEDVLTYSEKAKAQEAFKLDLPVSEKISAKDAMDALLLFSANDIAYMIGENIGGNVENFSKLMNDKVEKLGLKNTHFVTPNGLHDPNHYTTAYDLTVIGRETYKYPWIMETMAKPKSTVKTLSNITITMDNRNKLITKDGYIGGKTGFTSDAGRCLVANYKKDNRNIIGVVLKSEYDTNDTAVFKDMEAIINWSLKAKKDTFIKKDTIVKNLDSNYNLIPFISNNKKINIPFLNLNRSITIPIITKEDISKYSNGVDFETNYSIDNFDPRKLNKNKPIGTITIKERETSKTYDLYSTFSFDRTEINKFVFISSFILVAILSLCTFIIIKIVKRKKAA